MVRRRGKRELWGGGKRQGRTDGAVEGEKGRDNGGVKE